MDLFKFFELLSDFTFGKRLQYINTWGNFTNPCKRIKTLFHYTKSDYAQLLIITYCFVCFFNNWSCVYKYKDRPNPEVFTFVNSLKDPPLITTTCFILEVNSFLCSSDHDTDLLTMFDQYAAYAMAENE